MADTISSDSIAQDQLRAFIERIERLEEEKKAIADDIKEIYAEARGNGFDTKVLRKIISIRKMDHNERMEQEALLDLYMGALGMAQMPLFDDEDDEPPRAGRRQPEHRADATGLRQIGSVASGIVANLNTNPAPDASNIQAERQPESTEQSAGANAEEVVPPASSAPITGGDHANSEGNALASHASTNEPESPAIAEAGTPDSPASDFDYSSDVTPEAVEQMRQRAAPVLAAMGPLEVVDTVSLGSAADKSAGPEVSLQPAAPTKLKMNAEFFDEPHPACRDKIFCGGNSNLVLCVECRAAAGIADAHDGPTFQPEASVH